MFAGITGWHLMILLFMIVPFVLWLIALIQIVGSHADAAALALWIVVITILPIIGSIVWFVVGRRTVAAEVGQRSPYPPR